MQDVNTGNIQRLEAMITEARKISIVTHQKPDGDAMGSSIALYHFLRMYGKDSVRIILNDRFPSYLDFLTSDISETDLIFFQEMPDTAEILIKDSDLIFCLDFNAFHRTDRIEPALSDSKAEKILIDHHLNPDRGVFDLIFSDAPYDLEGSEEVIKLVLERDLLKDGGILIFEHSKDQNFSEHPNLWQTRSYGSVQFSFFKKV